MRVGLDVDGVICNFWQGYEELFIEVAGEDKFGAQKWPHALPQVWDWPLEFGYTKEQMGEVWTRIKASSSFWIDLDHLPAFETLKGWMDSLNNQHEIYFITNRMGQHVKLQTETWFGLRDLEWATVLISEDKGICAEALQLDYYIDDKAHNIEMVEFYNPDTQAYLLNQPYNRTAQVKLRTDSLEEFLIHVEGQPFATQRLAVPHP